MTIQRRKWDEEDVRIEQERRRSNAAGRHGDRRTKRRRSRSDNRRAAIKEGSE